MNMDKYRLANAFVDAFIQHTKLNDTSKHEFSQTFDSSGLAIINALTSWEIAHGRQFRESDIESMTGAVNDDALYIAGLLDKKINQAHGVYSDFTPWDAIFPMVVYEFLVEYHSMNSL